MNRILALLALFISIHSIAQTASEYPFSEENDALLWKIEGDSVHKDCYLFGTMHLISTDYFLFPKKLEKIASKTDLLVMELEGTPNQMEALNLIMLKEGSFFDYFNEAQEDSIINWANDIMHIDEETFRKSFDKFKPFAIVSMATQMQFIGKTESYEKSFELIADENEIEIKGLETLEEQMAVFDDLTDEQQAEMVMENIRSYKENLCLTKNMMKVYNLQQIDSLYAMVTDNESVISEEQDSFLDQRNSNWIPQIKNYIKDEKVLIAVGAGHLGGPNGLIRLLEKEGYILTPVKL